MIPATAAVDVSLTVVTQLLVIHVIVPELPASRIAVIDRLAVKK